MRTSIVSTLAEDDSSNGAPKTPHKQSEGPRRYAYARPRALSFFKCDLSALEKTPERRDASRYSTTFQKGVLHNAVPLLLEFQDQRLIDRCAFLAFQRKEAGVRSEKLLTAVPTWIQTRRGAHSFQWAPWSNRARRPSQRPKFDLSNSPLS